MRKCFWVGILIGGFGMGMSFAQSGLQLGFTYSMGRSFTQVDYTQANAENLIVEAGLVVPVGIELAWTPSTHWRIGTGISLVSYGVRITHAGGVWESDRNENITYVSIPVDIGYKVFGDPEMKKSFVFTVGGSYDLIEETSGSSTSSWGWVRDGIEIGRTQTMNYETISDVNISLRFGLAQEWRLGQKDRFHLQFYGLYSLGLMQIFESNYDYWAEQLPEGFDWGSSVADVLSEPLESYNSISSKGSYFTVGFKLYYNLIQ